MNSCSNKLCLCLSVRGGNKPVLFLLLVSVALTVLLPVSYLTVQQLWDQSRLTQHLHKPPKFDLELPHPLPRMYRDVDFALQGLVDQRGDDVKENSRNTQIQHVSDEIVDPHSDGEPVVKKSEEMKAKSVREKTMQRKSVAQLAKEAREEVMKIDAVGELIKEFASEQQIMSGSNSENAHEKESMSKDESSVIISKSKDEQAVSKSDESNFEKYVRMLLRISKKEQEQIIAHEYPEIDLIFSSTQEKNEIFGFNYYCIGNGYGADKGCNLRIPFAFELQSRRDRYIYPSLYMSEDVPQLNRTISLKVGGRSEWLTSGVLYHLNGSKCRHPIKLDQSAQRVDLGVDYDDANVSIQIGLEAFNTEISDHMAWLSFNRRAEMWDSSWMDDYGVDCNPDSDPECYFTWSALNLTYAKELRSQRKSLGAVVISMCPEWTSYTRIEFLKEFAKHFPLDSYGQCTPEGTTARSVSEIDMRRLLPGIPHLNKYQEKRAILATYDFAFELENNIQEDYITEKLFHALVTGNVVVSFGAPNLDEFRPVAGSWINALHFKEPKYLAQYLKLVQRDPNLYQKIMSFRRSKTKVRPEFLTLKSTATWLQRGEESTLCRFGAFYARFEHHRLKQKS